jgi:excisionase family DNA binding protein
MEQKLFTSLSLDELDGLIQNSILKVIKNQLPPQPEVKTNYLTRQNTADKLKISLPTLWKLTREGVIPAYKMGKRVLYRTDEVEKATRKMNFTPKL